MTIIQSLLYLWDKKIEPTGTGANDILFHFSGRGLFEKGFVWTREEMENFYKLYTWMESEYNKALDAEKAYKGI